MAEPTTNTPVISAKARQQLVSLIRAAFPHPDFPDGPYERTADEIITQLEQSLWNRLAVTQGLESLDQAAEGDFSELSAQDAEKLLHEIEDAEFFAFIRSVTVVTLYNDAEVWQQLGYEGESFSKGGYLHRGFDDLDWLPDPRIEEYDGPDHLVEVAPDDMPKAGAAR